jgi:serine protease Do
MVFANLPPTLKRVLIITIAVSALLGALVGGVIGALSAGFSGNVLWPYVSQSFGIGTGNTNENSSIQPTVSRDQIIIEDSATTSVVKEATAAVVSIVVTQDLSELYNRTGPFAQDPFFFGFPFGFQAPPPTGRREVGGGTGFIITTDGMIVTNRHVVDEQAAEYSVVLNDGTRYEAVVLARDTLNDIAIIKIEADNLPVLDLGDSESIQIGQTVIAIGNSLGEFSNTVTKGVVSGINRRVVAGDGTGFSEVIEEAIQTDAAINPGNSGGPLLDLFGRVIGVNTAVSREGQLIGFAIPINSVKNVIESVQQYGRIVRPFLGVRYILLNQEIAQANDIVDIDYGALIIRGNSRLDLAVVPGSPADKAGLQENDIILEIQGEKVTQDRGLANILAQYKPGDSVGLTVYQKGEIRELKAELSERE